MVKESCSWYETVVADKRQSSMIKKSLSWCRKVVAGLDMLLLAYNSCG